MPCGTLKLATRRLCANTAVQCSRLTLTPLRGPDPPLPHVESRTPAAGA